MKNKRLNGAIIVLIVVLLFSFCTCKAGAQTINSATELKAYLDKQPANSPDKPIKVAMKANEMMLEKIVEVLNEAGKYVSLDLSGSPLTEIPKKAFEDCTPLAGIIIPNSVTSIGYMAFDNTSITSVTIPKGVTSFGSDAFGDCDNLTSVTFQGTITSDNFGVGLYYQNRNGDRSPVPPIDGDLKEKYLSGGIGTYTRPNGDSETWTKK